MLFVGCGDDGGSANPDGGGGGGTYSVGGTVAGLAGSGLVLVNNGGDAITIASDGAFTFSTRVAAGAAYAITVQAQPTSPAQDCVVERGTGSVGTDDVTDVSVTCTTPVYSISGTVTGLRGRGLSIRNGSDVVAFAADGTFTFPTALPTGATYDVQVRGQPYLPDQRCIVTVWCAGVDPRRWLAHLRAARERHDLVLGQ